MKINLLNFPAIYMNLDGHKEKNESMQSMLKQIGFSDIRRVEGVLDSENSVAGCSKAHHKALNSFNPPFILFEDDCTIANPDYNLEFDIPDYADALYLGISSWGRMNGHNGFYNQYDILPDYPNILRIHNMLSGHAILYLTEIYTEVCRRVTHHAGYTICNYQDVGFAEIQRFFNVYSLDRPMFHQIDHPIGTSQPLTSYESGTCTSCNSLQFYPYPIK